MPKPLRSKDKNGEPFARPPEIDACLQRLESVDAKTRLRAFAISSRKSDGYVPSEALTYFLRRAHATGENDEFKQLFGLLMKRVGQSLHASIPDSRMAGARDIREEAMSRFAERIAKDCSGRFAMLDFFEVRFDLAIARFRKSVLRQIGPTSVLTVPLSTDDDGVRTFHRRSRQQRPTSSEATLKKLTTRLSGWSWTLRLTHYQTIRDGSLACYGKASRSTRRTPTS